MMQVKEIRYTRVHKIKFLISISTDSEKTFDKNSTPLPKNCSSLFTMGSDCSRRVSSIIILLLKKIVKKV